MRKVFIIVSVLIIFLTLNLYAKEINQADNELRKDYLSKGLALDDAKEYKKAIAIYSKAIRLAPSDSASAEVYFNRGCSYVYLKKNSKAISDYNKAIKLSASPNDAYYYCRGILYYNKRNYLMAIKDFNRVIELIPESEAGTAYYYRGAIYHKQNNYYEAIDNFNKAIEIDPNNADACNDRGTVYFDVGNFKLARADWDKAIELDPQGEGAKIASKNLRLLSGKTEKKIAWGQKKEEKSGFEEKSEEDEKNSLADEWKENIAKTDDALSDLKLSSAQIYVFKSVDIAKQLKGMVKGNDEQEEVAEAMENISLGLVKFIKGSRDMEKLAKRMENVEKNLESAKETLDGMEEVEGYIEESLVYFEAAESKASAVPYLLEKSQEFIKVTDTTLEGLRGVIGEMEEGIEGLEKREVEDSSTSNKKSFQKKVEKKVTKVDSGEIKKLEEEWATYIKDTQKAIDKKDFFSATVYVNTSLELLSHLEGLLKNEDLSRDKLKAMLKVSSIYEHLRGLAEALDADQLSSQDKENLDGAIEFTYKQLKEIENSSGNVKMIQNICKDAKKALKKIEDKFAALSKGKKKTVKKKVPEVEIKEEEKEEFIYERRKDLWGSSDRDADQHKDKSDSNQSNRWGR
ncbi:MAG: tetratricopeptide repeat protein [Candidatus Omnitrophica bacterium]|nr:tetratricopeptide repeat protein [Candidatus Omnitrophota bacterium]